MESNVLNKEGSFREEGRRITQNNQNRNNNVADLNRSVLNLSDINKSIFQTATAFEAKMARELTSLKQKEFSKDAKIDEICTYLQNLTGNIEKALEDVRINYETLVNNCIEHLKDNYFIPLEEKINWCGNQLQNPGNGPIQFNDRGNLFGEEQGPGREEIKLFLEQSRIQENENLVGLQTVRNDGNEVIYVLQTRQNRLEFRKLQRMYDQTELGRYRVFFNKGLDEKGNLCYFVKDKTKDFDMDKFVSGKINSVKSRFNPRKGNDGRSKEHYYVFKYNHQQLQFIKKPNTDRERYKHKCFFIIPGEDKFSIFVTRRSGQRRYRNNNQRPRWNSFKPRGNFNRYEGFNRRGRPSNYRGGPRSFNRGRPQFFRDNLFDNYRPYGQRNYNNYNRNRFNDNRFNNYRFNDNRFNNRFNGNQFNGNRFNDNRFGNRRYYNDFGNPRYNGGGRNWGFANAPRY